MRRWMIGLVVGAFLVFPATSSLAGALTQGTFTFILGTGSPLVFTGDGSSSGSAIDSENVTLAAGSAFAGTGMLTVTGAPPLSRITAVVNNNTGGGWTGFPLMGTSVGVNGQAVLKGLGGVTLLAIPFVAGVPGTSMTSGGGVTVTIESFGWTAGQLMITNVGSMATTITLTGNVVTGTPGSVSLVAGSLAVSNLADPTPSLFDLTLDFTDVPEPVAPGMLLAGAAALAGVAWRKRKA